MKRECRSASSAAKIAIQTKEAHFVSAMLVMKGLMDILALLAWLENISQNGAMARVTTAQKGRTQNREVQHHAPDVRQESSQKFGRREASPTATTAQLEPSMLMRVPARTTFAPNAETARSLEREP